MMTMMMMNRQTSMFVGTSSDEGHRHGRIEVLRCNTERQQERSSFSYSQCFSNGMMMMMMIMTTINKSINQ